MGRAQSEDWREEIESLQPERRDWLVKIGAMGSVADLEEFDTFEQLEGFITFALPFHRDAGDGWSVFLHWDITAGILRDTYDDPETGEDESQETELVSMGPRIGLEKGWFVIDAGSRVTYLGDENIGSRDLDGPFQFISHARIGVVILRRLEIGGRIQHMSNAGIYESNPGADLVVVDVGCRF